MDGESLPADVESVFTLSCDPIEKDAAAMIGCVDRSQIRTVVSSDLGIKVVDSLRIKQSASTAKLTHALASQIVSLKSLRELDLTKCRKLTSERATDLRPSYSILIELCRH